MLRVVADLGNSRLKWGRIDESGTLVERIALPVDDPAAWADAWNRWKSLAAAGSSWAVSSVNPPVAERLAAFLESHNIDAIRWIGSAAAVPVAKDVEGAESGGSDRALAVYGAVQLMPQGRPGLVIMCGTAITVERVTARGVWQGGAIAMGLGLAARSLHHFTAQLPLITLSEVSPSWGRGTRDSLEAGVFWGTVGAIRELIFRQVADLGGSPWVVWTGGDAERLAAEISGYDTRVEPDLILKALAQVALRAG
ncbi:MAG: type III pantothenate kinase [Isosphaeraceae bacterium]